MLALLNWTHYVVLMALKNDDEVNYYISISFQYNLSYPELAKRINRKEYQRLDNKTKDKLISKQVTTVTDYIKNSIIIKKQFK